MGCHGLDGGNNTLKENSDAILNYTILSIICPYDELWLVERYGT